MRLALVAGLLAAQPCSAQILDSAPAGFHVQLKAEIAAAPQAVYQQLGKPGQWWDAEHTFSGEAKNMSLSLKPGGCFCEKLEGGSLMHAQVIYAKPGELLRLTGALGPLQELPVAGVWSFALKANGNNTLLTMDYRAGGYLKEGLDSWAKAVDEVLDIQLQRLKRQLETGRADPPKTP
ncbi:MAG: ATPase [Gammaproteobacteria bacterium]|nr:ATPase [Gammaproteobacteria bacterium]